MKLFVTVKPKAKKKSVMKIDRTHYVVAVTVPPEAGKANSAVRDALAEFLDVPKSRMVLSSGEKSREKTFEIL